MFKVNNKDTRTTLLAYLTPCSTVSIVNFEHTGWDLCILLFSLKLNIVSFLIDISQELSLVDITC